MVEWELCPGSSQDLGASTVYKKKKKKKKNKRFRVSARTSAAAADRT